MEIQHLEIRLFRLSWVNNQKVWYVPNSRKWHAAEEQLYCEGRHELLTLPQSPLLPTVPLT